MTKGKGGKPKESKFARKQTAKRRYLRKGHTEAEWRAGRRSGRIQV